MASLIHELENNEALLLMYLTGELPAEDCIEVEQMLSRDSGMRAELMRIESAYQGAMASLSKLDEDRTVVPAENHAIRQAMRAMRQWQVDRLARQPVEIPASRIKFPVWMYPFAGVAALLIGSIAWWGFGGSFHFGSNATGTQASSNALSIPDDPPLAPSTDEVATAMQLDNSLSTDARAGGSSSAIAKAEEQARSLVARSDAASVSSSISLTDANP